MLAQLANTLMGLVDTIMVGRISIGAVAAVGVATLIFGILANAMKALEVAVQAVTARRVGEGRDGDVGQVLGTALAAAVSVGAVVSVVAMLTPETWLSLVLDEAPVRAMGASYLVWRYAGLVPYVVYFLVRACFDGIGWTRVGMVTGVGMNLANVLLNWIFIFGNLGAPEMGVAGAALASGLATVLSGGAIAVYALRPHVRHRFRFFAHGNVRRSMMALLLRVGWPPMLQAAGLVGGIVAFYVILGRLGTVPVAAANIVMRIAALSLMPTFGIGIAVQTMVGQSLGAGDPRGAVRVGWGGVAIGVVFMAVLGLPFLLAPDTLLRVFVPDPALLAAGRPILRLTAAVQVLAAVGVVLGGAQRGAGATRAVMLVDVLTGACVMLPVTWLAAIVLHRGLVGAWLALVLWVAVHALIMTRLFKQGRWLRVRI